MADKKPEQEDLVTDVGRKCYHMANKKWDQRDLLRQPWDVLIVLDAARADETIRLDRRFTEVWAAWGITHSWVAGLWGMTAVPPIVHYTANPVVTYSWIRHKRPKHVHVVDVWRECWKEFGKRVGSVEPRAVNDFVARYPLGKYIDQQNTRLVIHYLQPHAPYIKKPLPIRTGNITQGPTPNNHMAIADAVKAGIISWGDVRAAYRANLELVLKWCWLLVGDLRKIRKGRYIITSDHGEQLGERGVFGHGGKSDSHILKRVPWWEATYT